MPEYASGNTGRGIYAASKSIVTNQVDKETGRPIGPA
jgi:hypothetical protein